MKSSAVQKEQPQSQPRSFGSKESLKKIRETHGQELVIGLCGPIGTPLARVGKELHNLLTNAYGFDTQIIKLSRFIEEWKGEAPKAKDRFERYSFLQTKGNELRDDYGYAVLAELAIKDILLRRAEAMERRGEDEPAPVRFCHLIDSIKNPDELELLRLIYGDLFVLIGVHASPRDREKNLMDNGVLEKSLSGLIVRDSGEDLDSGQAVRKTFPAADFFINTSKTNATELNKKLKRVLEIVTRSRIVTPTKSESAMYSAYAASMNSGCLSRQVGAVVTDAELNIIGTGWNDVPKYGGGLYTEGRSPDRRCMHEYCDGCANDAEKKEIGREIVGQILDLGKKCKIKRGDQECSMSGGDLETLLENSRVDDLIEFSRAVHAEMMCLINAGVAGEGARIQGGKIFVTTYPCHNCAKHIVAAGIAEVYFIEPYRKSLARRLHPDTIADEEGGAGCVKIIPYEGAGPSRYVELFKSDGHRKDAEGHTVKRNPRELTPPAQKSIKSYPELEYVILEQLRVRGLAPASEAIQPAEK